MSKQKLIDLKEKVEALNAELKEVFKDGLKEYALDLLIKHPKIKGFSWTQYTPYFNDGEPCEFGINIGDTDILITTKDGNEWLNSYEISEFQRDSNGKRDWTLPKLIKKEYSDWIKTEELDAFSNDLADFAKNALFPFEKQVQSLLGEGKVIVTPFGIEVEDYDHD